jgi:hypothetical protein
VFVCIFIHCTRISGRESEASSFSKSIFIYISVLFNDSVSSSDTSHWKVKWLMNDELQRKWMKTIMAYLRYVLLWYLSGRTMENHKRSKSGYFVSWLRFEQGIFQLQVRNITIWASLLDENSHHFHMLLY